MYFDKYTAEDFALLEEFRTWVLTPNRDSNIFWADWLEKNPDKLATIEQARLLVEHVPSGKHSLDQHEFDAIVNRIEEAIDSESLNSPVLGEKDEKREQVIPLNSYSITEKAQSEGAGRQWKRWLSYAAALLVLVAGAFFFNQFSEGATDAMEQFVTTESPRGQISLINLPDGSRVWLNAGSSIRYIEHFSEVARDIYLDGEAYFEVARDTTRPFTVIAGNTSTTALGTSFNINNYTDNSEVEIELLTGKVSVKSISENRTELTGEFVLQPGERATYSKGSGQFDKGNFDPAKALNWKNGIIQFENATFTEVKNTLERVYAIDISTDNKLNRTWSYNGQFSDEPLELVLKKLSLTEDFSYEIDKNKVRLQFNR